MGPPLTMKNALLPMLLCSTLGLCAGVPKAAQAQSTNEIITLDKLEKMEWSQLDALFRHSSAGQTPCGFYRGRVFSSPDKCGSKILATTTNTIWVGKHIDSDAGTVLNQWRIGKVIKGQAYTGSSWFDEAPSFVMDYSHTSLVWKKMRDELREVAPGVYLGVTFQRNPQGGSFRLFFGLERCD